MCPHCSFAWPADTLEFLRSNLSASPFGDGLLGLLHLTSCGIPLPVCRICLPRPFSTLLLGLALNLSSSLMALLIFHTKSQRGWCLTDPQEPYDFLAECHVWSRLLEAGCRLCWPQWRTRQAKPSNAAYIAWTGCIRLRLAPGVDTRVRSFMQSFDGLRAIRRAAQFGGIASAAEDSIPPCR